MQRNTQLWLAGTIVVSIGLVGIVIVNQRGLISEQQQALDQQNLLAEELKEQSDEASDLRQQEATFALQLKTLDAEQARSAASAAADQASLAAAEQRSLDRQRLEGQIQDLKIQREKLARQATCTQIQASMRTADRNGDAEQVKALQERWETSCTNA